MKKTKLKRTFTTLGVLSLVAAVIYFSFNAFTFKDTKNENSVTQRTQPKYSNVRIFARVPADFQKIEKAGLDWTVDSAGLFEGVSPVAH